jgi:hypothetical protein
MRQITVRVCGNPARPLTLLPAPPASPQEPVSLSLSHPPSHQPPHLILPPNPSHLLLTLLLHCPRTKTEEHTQAGNFFPHAAKDQWATFSGVLEAISGRSQTFKLALGTLTLRSLRQSTRNSPPGICNYRVAFVDICIRGLCQPGRAVSFRRRLRANFSLACTWSALGTLGYHGMLYPRVGTISLPLPLQGPNIRFPYSHLRLHPNVPPFLVANGSSTPTSFSLSLVSLSVHLFSHSNRLCATPTRNHLPPCSVLHTT